MSRRIFAFCCVLLLLAAMSAFPVGAIRRYDIHAEDFLSFSQAVAQGRRTVQSEVLVKSSKKPDFRPLHPQFTAEGPDGTYVVRFATAREAKRNLKRLQALPGVEYAECNDYVTVQSGSARTAEKSRSWGVHYMRSDVLADWIYNNNIQRSAVVAVVDSGITASHPIFQGRIHSGVSYLKTPYTTDESGHGTAVAGIIADVTAGLNVKLMVIKAINDKNLGTLSDVTAGIKYAASHGADIVNISFVSDRCHPSLHDAIRYALGCGCLPIISAGNYGTNMDKEICCPAHMAEPIVVTGCTNLGLPYYKNCYGSTVDLCAPGSNVVSASKNGRYARVSGTSFAAPHVSGVAALYKLCYPGADVYRLMQLLTENTRDHGKIGFDTKYGWGVPSLNKADILSTGVSPTANFTAAQWVEYILFFGWVRYV